MYDRIFFRSAQNVTDVSFFVVVCFIKYPVLVVIRSRYNSGSSFYRGTRLFRSEERRVGKECRSRWSLSHRATRRGSPGRIMLCDDTW